MQRLSIALIISAGFLAHASFAEYFPIMLRCTDQAAPETKLEIKVNIAQNQAQFIYESALLKEPVNFFVSPSPSANSSSVVQVSSHGGGYFEGTSIKISAHSYETFRVTHYANFSLELSQDSSGAFKLKKAEYDKGTTEYPEFQVKGSVALDNLSCTLQGL